MLTQILLQHVVARQGSCVFVAGDVAAVALDDAQERLARALPTVKVRKVVGQHTDIGGALHELVDRQVLLFIGSSIGNLIDADAIELLSVLKRSLRYDAVLILGADLRKDPQTLRAAYDDAAGVTARFSSNMLTRINRDAKADFDTRHFRHVAEWDDGAKNIEVFLESTRDQRVHVGALDLDVMFARGERIHTETCAKYDDEHIDHILTSAGFQRVHTHLDSESRFSVDVARVEPRR